ncbi:MAG TPA: sigma-70 family RNA polymerase sigma factor [Baekduia sp.]|uniref:sigma-70 family RNA polymerase sigma factor n=1 Tax=Baekduia sp. TaxID=2600305 RepID=UPI002D7947D3|nr:sigma-70 family RNA polymerase sigma factor [Baekduia sp.]HET6507638.1 sigma-70 family RNA polymerase sigma factor [Baekduia sp.]
MVRTVATQAESLMRTARRHSLCADDAYDAYQRGMEIFLRRARTLDPESAHKWLHVVVKHEAMEVRRGRSASVAYEDLDLDRHASAHDPTPEERVVGAERTRSAAEALRRLKPQELRAMWLKALGHSYVEIGEATGYSQTKVNRSLTEGRKSFFARYEGIESGAECERWQPVLTAMARGEATAEQITDARPHLRNCPSCRGRLKALHRRPLTAMLPLGLVSLLGRLGALAERVLPGGDASMTAVSGTKLAALLATGAAATAGGGFVMAQEQARPKHAPARHAVPTTAARAAAARGTATMPAVPIAARTASVSGSAPASGTRRATPTRRHRVVARRKAKSTEFAPAGAPVPVVPQTTTSPRTPTPTPITRSANPTPTPSATPRQLPHPTRPDTSHGEFSPQP